MATNENKLTKYTEEGAMFCAPSFFGDDYEHCYDVDCYDGWAIGTRCNLMDADAPTAVLLTYPTLAEVLATDELSAYVLRYRGLYDLTPEDIHYGDIMMAFGALLKPVEKEKLVEIFSGATYGSDWLEIRTLKSEAHLDEAFSPFYLESRCREDRWADRLLNGGHIVCLDWYSADDNEDGAPDKYRLTFAEVLKGFELARTKSPRLYAAVFKEGGNPDYYDYMNIMQYVIFGEEVYG